MASLAHVTQWFLQQEVDPDERKLELSLREPAPRRPPSFWERRRLMIAYPWDMPSLARGIRGEGNAILVSYSDSSVARLGALLQFHAREVSILVDICRAVLRRETTDDVNNASPDRLADMFDALCDLRPTVVPRAVSVQVREVVRRLKSVERAIRQRETQVDHFFTEAERKSALNEIVAWFEEAYVQRHFLERRGVRSVITVAVVWFLGAGILDSCKNSGASDLRNQLLRKHCADSSASATPICVDLRSYSAASSAAPKKKSR